MTDKNQVRMDARNGPRGLSAEVYTDSSLLEKERLAVFDSSWQFVAYTSDLPKVESYISMKCGSEEIVLVRRSDASIGAMSNVCRHRGASVARGSGQSQTLVCPYHGWQYSLNGNLMADPVTSYGHDMSSCRLPEFTSISVPPFIFVRVSAPGRVTDNVFDPMANEIRNAGFSSVYSQLRVEYIVQANWKLVMENFLECVHCPYIHPESLATSLDLDKYESEIHENYVRFKVRSVSQSELGTVPRNLSSDSGATRHIYSFYPNFAVSLLRGLMVTFCVQPLDVGSTLIIRDYLIMVPDFPIDDLNTIQKYYDRVMREDIAIVEQIQRNMSSRLFLSGAYMSGEEAVKDFREQLRRDLK